MKQLAAVVPFLLVLSVAAQTTGGQSASPWITSINYEQITTSGSTTMDIHVGLIQPGATGFPCPSGSTLTVDPLSLSNADIKSSQDAPHVNPLDLNPTAEAEGYVYHLPVGVNLDLPVSWQSFTVRVQAHCTGLQQVQPSPAVVVRRFATNNPLQVSIVGGEPQWNRSGGQDILSFVIKSNLPVAIQNLVIRDANLHNVVTEAFSDPVDATSHNIALKSLVPLQGRQQYSYDAQFTGGGLSVTPIQPLPQINLPAQPTKDFSLVQFPGADQLTIRDASKDFTFTAQANDSGTVDIVFDTQQIDGSNTVHSTTSADGVTHTFTITRNNIPRDGQYSFRFVGNRPVSPSSLVDAHPSVLVVATKTFLTGPIGLGLSPDSKSIIVTYCLSQTPTNEVRISNNPSTFSVVGTGNRSADGIGKCNPNTFLYAATIPLSDFSAKVASAASSPVAALPASPPQQLPIQLEIVDTSSAARPLTTLSLAAVLLSNQNPSDLVGAVTKVTDKNASKESKDTAAQTLVKQFGIDANTVNDLRQLGNKGSGVGGTIATVLGTLGKNFVTAYLGIPAPK